MPIKVIQVIDLGVDDYVFESPDWVWRISNVEIDNDVNMLVCLSGASRNANDQESITFRGVSFTEEISQDDGNVTGAMIWSLRNPPTGIGDVEFVESGTSASHYAILVGLSGVDTEAATIGTVQANGFSSGGDTDVNVNTLPGAMCLEVSAFDDNVAAVQQGEGQNVLIKNAVASTWNVSASWKAATGGLLENLSWTHVNEWVVMCAFAVAADPREKPKGAYLPLFDKMRAPALFIPNRKPIGPVVIDWNIPITKGLKRVYSLRDIREQELVKGFDINQYGSTPNIQMHGNLMVFSGDTGDYIREEAATADDIESMAQVTVACRFRLDSAADDDFGVVSKYHGFNQEGWEIIRDIASNKWQWWVGIDDVSYIASSTNDTAQREWVNLIGTYDNETSRLYIDGIENDSNSSMSGNMDEGGQPVNIGRASSGANAYFNGGIDYLMIWDRALSAAEITLLNADPYQLLIPAP